MIEKARSKRCPHAGELSAFLNDQAAPDSQEKIAEHVVSCHPCQHLLEQLAACPVNPPRNVATSSEAWDGVLAQRITDQLRSTLDEERSTAEQFPTIPGCEVRELLGRGGMGAVYLAWQRRLERLIAVKVLSAPSLDRRAQTRFAREVAAVGQLNHPGIVTAFDANSFDGTHYLLMEYVEGSNLSQILRHHNRLRVADACEVVRQTAIALQYAHDKGMIHRDVKPSNLMVTPSGGVKLLDLGLASISDADSDVGEELTTSGQVLGTIEYMAPEQASRSSEVDARSDVFGLGATVFKLLTGSSPVDASGANTKVRKLAALIQGDLPSVRTLRNDLPKELVAVVDRMLALHPDDRFASAANVADVVGPFCEGSQLPQLAQQLVNEPLDQIETQSVLESQVSTHRDSYQPPRRPLSSPTLVKKKRLTSKWPSLLMGFLAFAIVATSYALFRDSRNDLPTSNTVSPPNSVAARLAEIDTLPLATASGLQVKAKSWEPGPVETAFPGGLVPTPRVSPKGVEWQLYCNSPIHSFKRPRLSWSPDGKWITIGETNCTKLFNVSGTLHKVGPPGIVCFSGSSCWSADSRWLATISKENLHFWSPVDLETYVTTPLRNFSFTGWNDQSFGTVGPNTGMYFHPDQRDAVKFASSPYRTKGLWSPDGEWFAVYSDGEPVQLFRSDGTRGPTLPKAMYVPQGVDDHYSVNIHWSPKSDRLAFATSDSVQVWTTQGKPVGRERQLFSPARCVRWNPDGSLLAAVERSGTIQVWFNPGTHYQSYEPNEHAFLSIDWVGRKRLVARDEAGKLWLLHHDVAIEIGSDPGPEFGMVSTLSPDNNKLVLSGPEEVKLIDLGQNNPRETHLLKNHETERFEANHICIAWSSQSNRFVSCNQYRHTQIYDMDAPALTRDWLPRTPTLKSLAWDNDGYRFATTSDDGTVLIWSSNGALERRINCDAVSLAWHPNSRHLAVATSQNECQIWDTLEEVQIAEAKFVARPNSRVSDVVFHPDNADMIIVATEAGISKWNWRALDESETTVFANVGGGKISWDAHRNLLTTTPREPIDIWIRKIRRTVMLPTQGLQVIGSDGSVSLIKLPNAPAYGAFAVSPNAKEIISIANGVDGVPRSLSIDLRKGSADVVANLPKADFEHVHSLAWSADGKWLAVATESGVQTLNADGRPGNDLQHHDYCCDAIAAEFSPDGHLLTAVGANRVAIWDSETRQLDRLICVLPDHEAIVLSPAGEVLWQSPNAAAHLSCAIQEEDGIQRVVPYETSQAAVGFAE